MSARIRSVVHAFIATPALAVIALCIAVVVTDSAPAEVRRQPLREIDILIALIDADVPAETWPVLEEPILGYRGRVVELERTWADAPSLDRPLEQPADLQMRRREQERRSQALATELRRLIEELRTALLVEHGRAEFDASRIDALPRWLEARAAARTFALLEQFTLGPKHLPSPALLDLPPEDRRAIARAMEPGLVEFAKKGDGLLAAELLSAAGNHDRRLAAADDFLAASTALRHLALKAASSDSRGALERSLTVQLDPYSLSAGQSALMRRSAPRVRGLDDDQRETLRQAARAVDTFLDEHRRQMIDPASSHGGRFVGQRNPNSGIFVNNFPGLDRAWRQSVTEVLGERSGSFFRVFGRGATDSEAELIELFGDEVAAEIRADRDAEWQLRQIAAPTSMTDARWNSLTDIGPVSEALRTQLRDLIRDAGDSPSSTSSTTTSIDSVLAAHDAAWQEIEPLQARVRANFDGLPKGVDDRVDVAGITADLATLRHAIEGIEADLAKAIASLVGDPLDVAEWRLARAMELLAPLRSTERRLWAPLLPSPPHVQEVLERAGYLRDSTEDHVGVAGRDGERTDVAALALAIAYGIALDEGASGDRLVPALWERQGQLECLRMVMVIRESLLPQRLMQSSSSSGAEAFDEKITSLLRAFGIDAGAADLAVIQAWEAIQADWAVALPDDAPALRRAWLLEIFPELHWEWVPTAGAVRRLTSGLDPDDPRRTLLDRVAQRHVEERAELIATTAEALARIPRSAAWVSFRGTTTPDPRQRLGNAYRAADRDLAARTLRRAIAALGGDAATSVAVIPAALARLEVEIGF